MAQQDEPWIETYTGKQFHFLSPAFDEFDIRDIAHSLAFTCRFTGHSNRFYSVAEHSIFVSYLAADPLAGLLHDASEAYITDIASPLKPHLHNYKKLEDELMHCIAHRYDFSYPLDPDIKDCDNTQLKTEAKYLLKSKGIPWVDKYPTRRQHGIRPQCMGPEQAEKAFLDRYEEVRHEFLIESRVPAVLAGSESAGSDFYTSWRSGSVGPRNIQANSGSFRGSNQQRQGSSINKAGGSTEGGGCIRYEGPDTSPCETEAPIRGGSCK
jgi:hypothetical protein